METTNTTEGNTQRRIEVLARVENEKGELTREAGVCLVPAEGQPDKYQPMVMIKNHATGFSFETTLGPVEFSSVEKFLSEVEEKLKQPDVLEKAEKTFRRLAALITLLR